MSLMITECKLHQQTLKGLPASIAEGFVALELVASFSR